MQGTLSRIAVLATVLTFLFAAVASARIVVNRGMFGVKLGDTMKQVRHTLGNPVDVFGRGSDRTFWDYPGRRLTVAFRGKHSPRLLFLDTTNPKQRTGKGLGVGSSEQAVKRAFPGVQCSPSAPVGPGTDCFVFRDTPRTVTGTDFHIGTNGRVDDVSIDLSIDQVR